MTTINIVITMSNNFIMLRWLNIKLKVDRTLQACNHNNLICIHDRDLDIMFFKRLYNVNIMFFKRLYARIVTYLCKSITTNS